MRIVPCSVAWEPKLATSVVKQESRWWARVAVRLAHVKSFYYFPGVQRRRCTSAPRDEIGCCVEVKHAGRLLGFVIVVAAIPNLPLG
jgi:hypothetical protein